MFPIYVQKECFYQKNIVYESLQVKYLQFIWNHTQISISDTLTFNTNNKVMFLFTGLARVRRSALRLV